MTSPQRKVQHHYVDHANDAENSSNSMSATISHSSDRTFPVTLHFLLNELQSDGLDHIISWQPHGRCFVVHNQAKFTESVLPMYVMKVEMHMTDDVGELALFHMRTLSQTIHVF